MKPKPKPTPTPLPLPLPNLHLLLLLLLLLSTAIHSSTATPPPPPPQPQLQLNTTLLPPCALTCPTLTAARTACTAAACFCARVVLAWERGCGGCSAEEDARVKGWVYGLCGDVTGIGVGVGVGNGTTTTAAGDEDMENEMAAAHALVAREWWKTHYVFFLLAFLLITVPILCYAAAIPLRKWCKRQLIRHRPREMVPAEEDVAPYTSVFAPGGSRHGELDGLEGVLVTGRDWADVRSGGSWEERVRDEFEGKERGGSRLWFWRGGVN